VIVRMSGPHVPSARAHGLDQALETRCEKVMTVRLTSRGRLQTSPAELSAHSRYTTFRHQRASIHPEAIRTRDVPHLPRLRPCACAPCIKLGFFNLVSLVLI